MATLAFVGLWLMGTPMATRLPEAGHGLTVWNRTTEQTQLLIEMPTVGPAEVRSVAARLPAGVRMVDAPVRGSVPEATAGRLAIYVGAASQGWLEEAAKAAADDLDYSAVTATITGHDRRRS